LIPLRRSKPNHRECLTLWQKRLSRKCSKNGGDGGTGVYMREGTTSSVMAADRPYGELYKFHSVNPEYVFWIHPRIINMSCPARHAWFDGLGGVWCTVSTLQSSVVSVQSAVMLRDLRFATHRICFMYFVWFSQYIPNCLPKHCLHYIFGLSNV
jgi:hypothetical protein